MTIIATDKSAASRGAGKTIVVGLGVTGLSCVRFLCEQHEQVAVADSRLSPPGLEKVKAAYPDIEIMLGEFDATEFARAEKLVLSPGVPLSSPAIQAAVKAGVEILGDIDLFKQAAKAPIVAITGSNGKSTVTTLVGEMAKAAGWRVGVGGNLGVPALELLNDDVELYVLELSSFQLEITHQLGAEVAVLLNLSQDHMDRYASMVAYHQAKQRIFQGCKKAVVNLDDPLSAPLVPDSVKQVSFGTTGLDLNRFSLAENGGEVWLYKGFDPLISVNEMKLKGKHNYSNALAALALGDSVHIPLPAMLEALRHFAGLDHRCQWIRTWNGIDFINDSKGTNVGATLTALDSFGEDKNIIWLAGGVAKGADFSSLQPAVSRYVKYGCLYGRDAKIIADKLGCACDISVSDTLVDAANKALKQATSGDVFLLSPACASMDQFSNFEERGNCFIDWVETL